MKKAELKKILKFHHFTEIKNIDEFLYHNNIFETFCVYKDKIYVEISNKVNSLSFNLDFSKKYKDTLTCYGCKDTTLYTSLHSAISMLMKYINCEITKEQIYEYIK